LDTAGVSYLREMCQCCLVEVGGLTRAVLNRLRDQDGASRVEPNLAAFYLFGMLNWIVMWFDSERNDPNELSESLVSFFLGGYRKITEKAEQ
jgi:hypothetical protein